MKRLFFLFFISTLSLHAQIPINGIIKDSESKKTLPFASITTENGFSTISDVDGKFNFMLTSHPKSITISYVGYKSKIISLDEINSFLTIQLIPHVAELKEVSTFVILLFKLMSSKDDVKEIPVLVEYLESKI